MTFAMYDFNMLSKANSFKFANNIYACNYWLSSQEEKKCSQKVLRKIQKEKR